MLELALTSLDGPTFALTVLQTGNDYVTFMKNLASPCTASSRKGTSRLLGMNFRRRISGVCLLSAAYPSKPVSST